MQAGILFSIDGHERNDGLHVSSLRTFSGAGHGGASAASSPASGGDPASMHAMASFGQYHFPLLQMQATGGAGPRLPHSGGHGLSRLGQAGPVQLHAAPVRT